MPSISKLHEEKFAKNEKRFARNEKRFAQLAQSQVDTDRRLKSLIEIVKKGRNGGGTHDDEHA